MKKFSDCLNKNGNYSIEALRKRVKRTQILYQSEPNRPRRKLLHMEIKELHKIIKKTKSKKS